MITLGTVVRMLLALQAQVQAVHDQNAKILTRLGAIMSEQSHLDAEVAQLAQEEADLGTALGTVQTEIEALKAAQQAGQPVDFTALDQHVAALQDLVAQAQQAAAAGAPDENPAPPAP